MNMHHPKSRSLLSVMVGLALWAFMGCASLQEAARFQRPNVELANIRLDSLDLEKLGLILDLKVDNPNALGIDLSKMDYDFMVAGNSLFKGTQANGIHIGGRTNQPLSLPLTIEVANLWQTIQKVAKADYFTYGLASRLTFALPIIGNVEIPLQKSGELPVLHLPQVSVAQLAYKDLSLTRADLSLTLRVANPNVFSLLLNQFNYDFRVNERSWVNGINQQPLRLDAKKDNEITIPITLNFLEMGATLYQMIRSKEPLDYHLTGLFDFGSSESFLKSFRLPVDLTGRAPIR